MAKLDFYFNNVKVNEDIKNWRDLEIELNFEDISGIGTIRTGTFEFTGAMANRIKLWNAAGLTGGQGILEAPPFRIEVCGANNILFDGGINTGACETLYQCDEVDSPLRERDRADFVDERENSFSFAYLASLPSNVQGAITQADYVLVPYVINTIPDGVTIITSIISLFVLVKELEQAIEKTAAAVAELIGDIIPTVGSGATIAVGAIIADIVKLILYLAYLAILTIAIIDLTILLFESIIQPTKYKKGMRVSKLFEKAAAHMGMLFSSTLLSGVFKDLVIIPKKTALSTNQQNVFGFVQNLTGLAFKMRQNDDAFHPASTGYYDGTFGDFKKAMMDVFNAKVTIRQTATASIPTMYFERVDYFQNQSTYKLPPLVSNYDPYGTNACELDANYYVTYGLDPIETNTYDLYEGNNIQHIVSPITFIKKGNILLKGRDERRLVFSRAKGKGSNNAVEDIFNVCYTIADACWQVFDVFCNVTVNSILMPMLIPINAILSVIGVPTVQPPSLPPFPPNPVGNRLSMLLLSSDFIGVPKLLLIDSANKVSLINESVTSAQYFMDQYHFINFPICNVDSNGNPKNEHNQWVIYKDKEIPLCCQDYLAIKNNNYCMTHDNKIAKVDSLIWNPYKEKAKITFRVKQLITKNLQEQYLINKN